MNTYLLRLFAILVSFSFVSLLMAQEDPFEPEGSIWNASPPSSVFYSNTIDAGMPHPDFMPKYYQQAHPFVGIELGGIDDEDPLPLSSGLLILSVLAFSYGIYLCLTARKKLDRRHSSSASHH